MGIDARTTLRAALFGLTLVAATTASATIQQHTFTISGDHGETGTGRFTWDDAVVPNGNSLNIYSDSLSPNLLSISITISGGNVVGGSTTFTRANCTGAYLHDTPDFVSDINFWCDNGSNSLYGVDPYTNDFNSGASTLTFAPGSTAPMAVGVPTVSQWATMLLAGIMAFGAFLASRRRH